MKHIYRLLTIVLTVALIACDYTMNDFPDKIEGQSYDLAFPVVSDTFRTTDLLVTIGAVSVPVQNLPPGQLLDASMNLEYDLDLLEYPFFTNEFDTDGTLEVKGLETVLHWADKLPQGITAQLLAYGETGGTKIYFIDPEEGTIQCGGAPRVIRTTVNTDLLNRLTDVEQVKLSLKLTIDSGVQIPVGSLQNTFTAFNIGMRIQFVIHTDE